MKVERNDKLFFTYKIDCSIIEVKKRNRMAYNNSVNFLAKAIRTELWQIKQFVVKQ